MSSAFPASPRRRSSVASFLVMASAVALSVPCHFAQAASVAAVVSAAGKRDTSIRPFKIHVPESELADLRKRIADTRWPDRETVGDASQGVQLATVQGLLKYWGNGYDWR